MRIHQATKNYLEAERLKRVLSGIDDKLLDRALDLASKLHATGGYDRAVSLERWIDKLSLSPLTQGQKNEFLSAFPELR